MAGEPIRPSAAEARRRAEAAELDERILGFIARSSATWRADAAEFNALALALFAHQYQYNETYRRWCERRGATPATITDWRQVPAVPTRAFKALTLTSFPAEQATIEYRTSGTTEGRSGRHLLESNRVYDAALLAAFRHHVLPDGVRLPAVVLFPNQASLPHSSLAHMLSLVVAELCAGGEWFITPEGADLAGACRALARHAQAGRPVLLLGTAYSFVHLLEALPGPLALPRGSRLMDTGGYKGRSREIPRTELLAGYRERLGLGPEWVVNEYGMTELGSQCYDGPLGRTGERLQTTPPWLGAEVVDPQTLAPVPPGELGILKHVDLANRDSVMAVQTDDLGCMEAGGFRLLGRAQGADLRGCSLTVEEILARAR
ncbi:MAG TPA: long-chain fatty acid--CoA ligase [Limnochordia bacterium]|nr:long-chain fatty acid--CoA ligase [Limnochordia bacterium]